MQRQKKIQSHAMLFFIFLSIGLSLIQPQQTSDTGTISDSNKVTLNNVNPSTYIVSRMGECAYNQSFSTSCYRNAANDFTSRFNLSLILDVFEKNENLYEIFSRCHEVTHYLSRNEYNRTKSIPEVYSHCTAVCHGGCYHGAIESYLAHKGIPVYGANDSQIIAEIQTVCNMEYELPQLYNECVHGIGHALVFITNGDLPYSLKLCDGLQSFTDRENCYSGVFMEGSSSSTNRDHPGKFISPNDPLYPCNILESRYLNMCYTYQSSYFSIITNYDWNKTIELCRTVPSDYRMGCFRFVGSNQVGYTQDFTIMKKDCDLIDGQQFKDICIRGVVSGLNGRYNGDESKIISFCSIVGQENKKSCYAEMGNQIRGWARSKEELRDKCLKIPEEEHAGLCLTIVFSTNNSSLSTFN